MSVPNSIRDERDPEQRTRDEYIQQEWERIEAIRKLADQSHFPRPIDALGQPHTKFPEPPESLLERRAWELLTIRIGRGEHTSTDQCFADAELFAAEAAKRRGGS